MAPASRLSTRVLLVCAAIGVATGLLGGIEGWLAVPVITGLPIVYGFLLGIHVLPGIVAQETLRLPWVALITHLIAALASSAVAPPYTFQFLGTAVLFGGLQEGVAALVRYRSWAPWRFFVSGLVIGVVVALAVFFAAHLSALPLWAQITYLILAVLGPVVWTAIGLWIGVGLRRAGVARR
ncbi:acyl esterase [Microbacterium sp. TS-1]|uniref:Energy-coupling factor transport system substrate-specific component n=1 Tax=Microbacterium paludicola TaxID=300019 RepID=A0ABU1I2Q8_9MICO|nr:MULTISPECIES: ECF transporter S component [Microbacterium]MDR6168179.1 energy-coupling factor transport system substrate-specific component [Microbacterium paludicola]QCR39176.1 acyl esterase [Microbacterium sp. SGAir0570]GAD34310.1 acyl esterase [Microbacterium sp. TS-1]